MPTILFLDDCPLRTKNFQSAFPSATCVATSATCIEELKKQDWDYVCLDHDLGGETFVDSDRADTGMEVVRWIVENKPHIMHIFVHSLNHPAAQEMSAKLRKATFAASCAPFFYLISVLQEDIADSGAE